MSFIGVNKSLSGKRWVGPDDNTLEKATQISKKLSISLISSFQLIKLGILPEDYVQHINPRVKTLLPDPKKFLDLEKGAKRFISAIENREKIAIFADYDVDGTVSASLLSLWLKNFSINPTVYIPDRELEGFGPNINAMKKLAEKHSLIVCVDCGSDSDEAIEKAFQNKTDVIVIDHHRTERIPRHAYAVINPNRFDEKNSFSYLCAAGVVFLFLVRMTTLKKTTSEININLLEYLDLVGLATIADVVPLVGLNRAFVNQGLKIFKNRPSLSQLLKEHNLEMNLTEEKVAFQIAPRLNASGRLDTARLTFEFLITDDYKTISNLIKKIELLNLERKELEKIIFESAMKQISDYHEMDTHVLSKGYSWHKGVIGIVAARLKERYNKPAIVISINKQHIGHGSIRSVKGIDLSSILIELKKRNILISGGGHKMAAGFSIKESKINEFNQIFSSCLEGQLTKNETEENLDLNGLINIDAINLDLIRELNLLGPFGSHSPIPIIVIPNCRLIFSKVVGKSHIMCKFKRSHNNTLDAICFNAMDNRLGEALLKRNVELHIAGELMIDDWQGVAKPKIKIVDIATC